MDEASDEIPFLERTEIEWRAGEFLNSVGTTGISSDVFDLATKLSIPFRVTRLDDGVSGKIVRTGLQAVIYINESDSHGRQNFTMAHELGHWELHPTRSWSDTPHTMYRRQSWQGGRASSRAEYQANLFAAALLMPEDQVSHRWKVHNSIHYLAKSFRVSHPAMVRRLEELKVIVKSVPGFYYADVTPLKLKSEFPPLERLSDADGVIPLLSPIALDENGRMLPMSDEERQYRDSVFYRAINAIDNAGEDVGNDT